MQSRIESAVEVTLNIATGFIVSMLIGYFVIIPTWDLDWTMADNFWVTAIYTITSVIRGYVWRRFFNRRLLRALARRSQGEAGHHKGASEYEPLAPFREPYAHLPPDVRDYYARLDMEYYRR